MIKLGIITFLEKYKFYRTKGSLAGLLTFIKVIFIKFACEKWSSDDARSDRNGFEVSRFINLNLSYSCYIFI